MTRVDAPTSLRSRLAAVATPRGSVIAAAIAAFLITVAQAPAVSFVYDAMVYWSSTTTLLSGGDFFAVGGMVIRGAWTVLVYLPAALVAAVSPQWAAEAVLTQNAVLVAVIGAVLVPAAAKLFVPVRPIPVWISAVITGVVFRGLAPFPIMDLWAVCLVLAAIVVVGARQQHRYFLLGGLLLTIAVNLRPAYVLPAVLVLVLWLVSGRLQALWAVLGGAIALLPQVALNAVFATSFLPWPVNLATISTAQSEYASYIVRYDTANYALDEVPRLFYCSPGMAEEFVRNGAPESMIGLVGAFFQTLPGSLQFVAQKVAASMFWTSATPYSGRPTTEISALTLIVVLVSVAGFIALTAATVNLRRSRPTVVLRAGGALIALWSGTIATLIFSTPEARFAIPLVLVGVIGVIVGVAHLPMEQPGLRLAVWCAGAAVIVVAVLLIGQAGLAFPAPLGDPTVKVCSDPALLGADLR